MDIFTVVCPHCQGSYYGDVTLLQLDIRLRCPHCNRYFKKAESPSLWTGEQRRSALFGVKGQLHESMIVEPAVEGEEGGSRE